MIAHKEFRELLFVVHYMEFDEFCGIFGFPTDTSTPRGAYAMDKYKTMQRSLLAYTGELDNNNIEVFFNYLNKEREKRYAQPTSNCNHG